MEITDSFDLEPDTDIFGFHGDLFEDSESDQTETKQSPKAPRFDFIIEPVVGNLHDKIFKKEFPEIFIENEYKVKRTHGNLKTSVGIFKIIYKTPRAGVAGCRNSTTGCTFFFLKSVSGKRVCRIFARRPRIRGSMVKK